ncbi:MAG: FkbM family methyltransferase [Chlorobium sp.]|uniref:rhamnan synthesis F family protein n=1 Tax=Chlorobium sp. TaxID=1095 RepID=UPI0025C63A3F|nr:rhamnan synthesis F family protein [Chlorobium sp.]MCF8383980.1 FkbM family methyltransferase [Chlorobium sp.]
MTGVLVEANQELIGHLLRIRNRDTVLHYAVTSSNEKETDLFVSRQNEITSLSRHFVEAWGNGLVGLERIDRVPTIRINRIFEQYFSEKPPIYLAVDVEGFDFEILQDIDWIKWRPAVVQIEPSDQFIAQNSLRFMHYLRSKGYALIGKTEVNLIFTDIMRSCPSIATTSCALSVHKDPLPDIALQLQNTEKIDPHTQDDLARLTALDRKLEHFNTEDVPASTEKPATKCILRSNEQVPLTNSKPSESPIQNETSIPSFSATSADCSPGGVDTGTIPTNTQLIGRMLACAMYPLDSGKRKQFRSKIAMRVSMPSALRYPGVFFGYKIAALLRYPMHKNKRRRYRKELRRYEEFNMKCTSFDKLEFQYSMANALGYESCIPLRCSQKAVKQQRICIVLHAYYTDVAEQIFQDLKHIIVPFDVFVTTSPNKVQSMEHLAKRYFSQGTVKVVGSENRGRNFAPFLVSLREHICKYDLMLHVHTKKSLRSGREQSDWRDDILKKLTGSETIVNGILSAFADNPHLGVVGPSTHSDLPYWYHHWLSVGHLTSSILGRLGIYEFEKRGFLDFPVGGMFWARTSALSPLLAYQWKYADFDPEPAPDDGTVAHVLERSIGVICRHSGFLYGEADFATDSIRIGRSEKRLGHYFETLTDVINKIVLKSKIVSFDFYDTLFTRLAATPEDVQSYIGHILVCEHRIGHDDDFLKLRKDAEFKARMLKKNGDVGIHEIYNAFPHVCDWNTDVVNRALELELELEFRVLVPRSAMLNLCRSVKKAGCRVIVVSDTYMDSAFLLKVLNRHGMTEVIDAVYCSSEIGYRKDNGTIWTRIKATEGIVSDQFIHIGDNEHSDIQNVYNVSLKAMGVINTAVLADLRLYPMPSGWRYVKSDWRTGIVLGPAIAQVGSNPFKPDSRHPYRIRTSYDFGYLIIGPVVFGFLSWLIRMAKQHGVSRLMFLSRGGYFLHRTYTRLATMFSGSSKIFPAASYLFVSRRGTLPAAYAKTMDLRLLVNGAGGFAGTFGELLFSRFGLNPSLLQDTESLNVRVKLPDDRDKVARLMKELHRSIDLHCQESAKRLKKYLEQEGFFSEHLVGVVDLGFSGTIQKALQAVTNRSINGYYFGITPSAQEVEKTGGTAYACYGEEQSGVRIPDIIRYAIFFEAVFAAPTGQVDGYRQEPERVVPDYIDQPDSNEHFPALERMADGYEAYCSDILKAYGPEALLLDTPVDDLLQPLLRVIAGWGGLPEELAQALVVEDEFCGNGLLDVIELIGKNIR